jgi:hypothetical protein
MQLYFICRKTAYLGLIMTNPLSKYLEEITGIYPQGNATEQSYHPALKKLHRENFDLMRFLIIVIYLVIMKKLSSILSVF